MSKNKLPPDFDEGTTFAEWMKLFSLLEFVTDAEKTKQGPLVYLHSFKNNLRARNPVESLPLARLSTI